MKDSSIQFPRVIIGAIALSVFGIIAILIINSLRPSSHTERLTPEEVRATGKCISCHERQTPGITKLHLESKHFKKGVSCLDCHKGNKGQKIIDHRGFKITKNVRSGNCKACHEKQYNQYERSRHSGPAWVAVKGKVDFTKAQFERLYKYHPKAMDRGPNKLAIIQGGKSEIAAGCASCHSIGKPNPDEHRQL